LPHNFAGAILNLRRFVNASLFYRGNNLRNEFLRISTIALNYHYTETDEPGKILGLAYTLSHSMATAYNMTLDFKVVPIKQVGKLPNGTWAGVRSSHNH
jgi:hypothetical protein